MFVHRGAINGSTSLKHMHFGFQPLSSVSNLNIPTAEAAATGLSACSTAVIRKVSSEFVLSFLVEFVK